MSQLIGWPGVEYASNTVTSTSVAILGPTDTFVLLTMASTVRPHRDVGGQAIVAERR
eukprot:m.51860 g.51860  ORF g.51860 m.51860 type:complete len:57 (-) comp21509_c0_seq2:130-300(-)